MENGKPKLRTIIAGSRTVQTAAALTEAIASCPWEVAVVISGGARGVDRLGEAWARANKIPLEIYHARWSDDGRAAGMIRNLRMVEKAEALIAIWDGTSRGTADMIDRAKMRGLPVHIRKVAPGPVLCPACGAPLQTGDLYPCK